MILHFDDSAPIYQQIAEDIRQKILSETLQPGEQLMSTTAYATAFRINPATAGKAFSLLLDEGLIEKRRGIGMFVTATAKEQIVTKYKDTYFETTLKPALKTATDLGLSETEILTYVTQYLATKRDKKL
ncbi:GntR family transcriptional regulator [Gleimia sp. 6138-11-ORH1]|uniref:GntR family transcriptional regulator n=1 Tax=Gleimia sp. 6138-11-ORH1 TaxID=2973937 RepID=UPI002167FEF9|nr:GntR family transcriptional regulator [Gleimia sp. 6138-11-ORH1]